MVGFRTKAENPRIIENDGAGVSSDDGILGGFMDWVVLERERERDGRGKEGIGKPTGTMEWGEEEEGVGE